MRPPNSFEKAVKDASIGTNEAIDKRILTMMRDAYDKPARLPATGQGGSLWRVPRLAAAAVILLAAGAFLGHLAQFGSGNVAWADVAARFQAVSLFNATIYIKDDGATNEPMQMELWWSCDGRARIRLGTQVVFARNGKITDAFDVATRMKVEANEWAGMILDKLGRADTFSLDAVIQAMFGGEMEDVTPLVNPDAVIAQDMVVFDVQLPWTPEWVRIWALRESRLPVRMRVWDPRNGDCTDAVFEYSREQRDEFFDPNAFGAVLQSPDVLSRTNIAYAFLQDAGGKDVTPEDMFEASGYHVPVVEQAGITPDGAVWVIAAKGSNRTPDGHTVYGFERLGDNLGREYTRVYRSHETMSDRSMEVFLPLDYPFDTRTPTSLTLTCEIDDYRPSTENEVIGTVTLTDWQQNAMWPEGTIRISPQWLRTQMAWRHVRASRYEQMERILATIEGVPEDNPGALQRERIRLRMLLQRAQYDEAAALAERLIPLLEANYRTWDGSGPDPREFADCILALARAGRLDQTKETWRRVKSLKRELPAHLNTAARRQIAESTQRGFEDTLRIMVPDLSRNAHLTVEQLNDLFDIDIKNNELFRHDVFWDWNPAFDRPEYQNWERHLEELSQYYQDHPLPETMEVLPRESDEPYAARIIKMLAIDSYYVENLQGPLKNYAVGHEFPDSVGCVRAEAGVADLALNHDLIYRIGTPQSERIIFMLDHFGLEIVEVNEPRTVWIARHDGRELDDFKTVRAPVPLGPGPIQVGMMSVSSASGLDMSRLFADFMWWQNRDLEASCILIIDETGLEGPVSRDSPRWTGPEAPAMARKWFADQFGVTFTEETRTLTTYVIRPKR